MSVRRGHSRAADHFTTIPNAWARDGALSLRARGLLLYLHSHREGWLMSERQLVAAMREGRDAVRGALRELEDGGYLRREKRRTEGGQVDGVDYVTTDPESLPPENPSAVALPPGNPSPGNPSPGNPHTKKNTLSEDQSQNISSLPVPHHARASASRRAARERECPTCSSWHVPGAVCAGTVPAAPGGLRAAVQAARS